MNIQKIVILIVVLICFGLLIGYALPLLFAALVLPHVIVYLIEFLCWIGLIAWILHFFGVL